MPKYYSDSFMDFIRHPTARRYVIRVRSDGSVRVTVPRWGSRRHAELFAEQQRPWIEHQRAQILEGRTRTTYTRGYQRTAAQGGAPAAGAAAQHGCTSRSSRVADQRTEPALALGVVLAVGPHLPELATRIDARCGPRLCPDSRAHAPAAARSLAPFLAPRRPCLPRLRARPPVAQGKQTPAHRRVGDG
jgi:hypothetical protein